jgi:hypothetical protein
MESFCKGMLKKRSIAHKVQEDVQEHIFEYLLLITSAALYITFLAVFKAQPTKQYIVTALFVLYYVVWGVIHHTRDQSLHLKIILEYIAIGALALILLRSLLF